MADGQLARPRLGFGTKLLYGSGAAANQLKQQSLSLLLLLFYNQVVGLDPRLVSSAIMVATFFDAFCDPFIGHLSDNLRSPLGRRHPFMYLAAIPVSVAFYMIWNPPMGWNEGQLFSYMLGCLLVIRLFDTCFELPSMSLAPELAPDYDDRTKLLAFRQMFTVTATLVLTLAIYQVFMKQHHVGGKLVGGVTDRAGYPAFSLVAAITIFTIIVISTSGTLSQIKYLAKAPKREGKSASVISFVREAAQTLKNRAFGVMAVSSIILAVGTGVTQSLQLYMGLFYWGLSQNQLTAFGICQVVSSFVGVYLAPQISRRLGKRIGAQTTGTIGIILSITPVVLNELGVMPARGSEPLFFILLASALGTTAFMIGTAVQLQAMIADVVEDSQVKTGRRSEGLLFSIDNLVKKAVSGVGVLVAGQLLHMANFPKDARHTGVNAVALHHLGYAYVGALIFFYGGCLLALFFYPLTRATHEENLRKLRERDARSAAEDDEADVEAVAIRTPIGGSPAAAE